MRAFADVFSLRWVVFKSDRRQTRLGALFFGS